MFYLIIKLKEAGFASLKFGNEYNTTSLFKENEKIRLGPTFYEKKITLLFFLRVILLVHMKKTC